MSDNGGYTIGRHDKNYPLSEGKGSLKEGGVREPMIVCYPHVAKPSTINDTPVIIEDFFLRCWKLPESAIIGHLNILMG